MNVGRQMETRVWHSNVTSWFDTRADGEPLPYQGSCCQTRFTHLHLTRKTNRTNDAEASTDSRDPAQHA